MKTATVVREIKDSRGVTIMSSNMMDMLKKSPNKGENGAKFTIKWSRERYGEQSASKTPVFA